MALIALSSENTRDYISKYDPDKKNPTVFKLGSLDPLVRAYIEDEMTTFSMSTGGDNAPATTKLQSGTRVIEIVRFGLKGVSNLISPKNDKEVPWRNEQIPVKGKSYSVVSGEILKLIEYRVLQELAEEIVKDNQFSEQEEKN